MRGGTDRDATNAQAVFRFVYIQVVIYTGRMIRLSCNIAGGLAVIFVLLAMSNVVLATSEMQSITALHVGQFVDYLPGVIVQRDGESASMDPSRPEIYIADSISTDAKGRAKITFDDGCTITLGHNSAIDVAEYVDNEKKSEFIVNVPQGLIRAITGKIVEQNPNGFRMNAPNMTAGIRGTTITLRVDSESTTIFIEDTKRQVFVNGADVPPGHKWIFADGHSRQERMTAEDRQMIEREFPDDEAETVPRNTSACIRDRTEKQKRWELAAPNARGPYPDYKCPGEYKPQR